MTHDSRMRGDNLSVRLAVAIAYSCTKVGTPDTVGKTAKVKAMRASLVEQT